MSIGAIFEQALDFFVKIIEQFLCKFFGCNFQSAKAKPEIRGLPIIGLNWKSILTKRYGYRKTTNVMRTRKNYIHKKPTNLSIFEESLIHQKEKKVKKKLSFNNMVCTTGKNFLQKINLKFNMS